MTDKLLVEVSVPVAQKTFEILLPKHLLGFEALQLIKRAVTDLTDGLFVQSEETTLCEKETGSILDLNLPIWKLGQENGSKLVLI